MLLKRFAGPLVAVLIVIAFGSWMFSGRSDATISSSDDDIADKSLIPKVQVISSEAQTVQSSLTINGITQASRNVTVRSEAEGKIIRLLKREGDRVSAGETIAMVDPKDLDARLAQAEAYLNQTRLEFEGAQRLQRQGLQNEAQAAAALAAHEQAKAQLAALELQQSNLTIRAPFAGQIENINLELGSFVRAGDAIAEVYDYSDLVFIGSVAEKDIAKLQLGQTGSIELINGEIAEGSVTYIGSVADPATRTFNVELTIDEVDKNVSGVTSVAELNLGDADGHFISPALLTINADGIMGLKTLTADNVVEFLPISILRSSPDGIWVSNLPDSTDIIVVGQGFVNHGDVTEPTFREFSSDVAVGL